MSVTGRVSRLSSGRPIPYVDGLFHRALLWTVRPRAPNDLGFYEPRSRCFPVNVRFKGLDGPSQERAFFLFAACAALLFTGRIAVRT